MFEIKKPPLNRGNAISEESFRIIKEEAESYPHFNNFTEEQKQVLIRLIHTTTNFNEIISNITFSEKAIEQGKRLLQEGATLIVDTNMIKSGISSFYTKKYKNDLLCLVNEKEIFELADKEATTRSYVAVQEAIRRNRNKPLILGCGNAPTFLYGAVKTLLEEKVDLSNVLLLTFPVGFVNVIESKEYVAKFMNYYGVEGIIMNGRYGASTLVVAAIHALYKLIQDFDSSQKTYNGK